MSNKFDLWTGNTWKLQIYYYYLLVFNCLSTLTETQSVKFIVLLKVIPKYGRNEFFFFIFFL